MSPFYRKVVPVLGLGGAPLLSIRIAVCGAAVVESPILGEWEYTGLTWEQLNGDKYITNVLLEGVAPLISFLVL